jgi:hypothetical protein
LQTVNERSDDKAPQGETSVLPKKKNLIKFRRSHFTRLADDKQRRDAHYVLDFASCPLASQSFGRYECTFRRSGLGKTLRNGTHHFDTLSHVFKVKEAGNCRVRYCPAVGNDLFLIAKTTGLSEVEIEQP